MQPDPAAATSLVHRLPESVAGPLCLRIRHGRTAAPVVLGYYARWAEAKDDGLAARFLS